MSENPEINTITKKENITNNEEIDILSIFKTLLRNKSFISKITLIGLIGGIFYSFSLKRIWQGEFQIVLTNASNGNVTANDVLAGIKLPGMAKFQKGGTDPLKTEVGILQSPLVLEEVFNFVKEQKSPSKKDNNGSITFNDWKRNSLDIQLERNTTILNLKYKDTDQKLILPVLQKISKSYQIYSGRNRLRKINLEKNYLEKQIIIFKEKSAKSSQNAQEYGFKENLSILQNQSEVNNEIPSQINIEAIRIQSANKIRDIEMQLEVINDIEDPDSLLYVSTFVPELLDTDIVEELTGIKKQLEFKKTVYKENDEAIKLLLRRRDLLTNVFKSQAIGYLTSKKLSQEAILKASDRKKGVLFKYRELLGIAEKDKQTLNNLEIFYRNVLLEEAKTEEPWELITTPTLLRNPIFPNKRLIVIYTFIFSVLGASLLTLIIDKRKNIIFESNKLVEELNLPLIMELSATSEELFESQLKLLFKSKYIMNKKKITFLKESKIDELFNNKLEKLFKFQNYRLDKIQDFLMDKESYDVILMPILGKTKISEMKKDISQLQLIGVNIIGMVIIKENINKNDSIKIKDELILVATFLSEKIKFFRSNFILNFKNKILKQK